MTASLYLPQFAGRLLTLKKWFSGKNDVTARDIKRVLSDYKKLSSDVLNNDLETLVKANIIAAVKTGKTVKYSCVTNCHRTVAANVTSTSRGETIVDKGEINNLKNDLSSTVAASVAGLELYSASVSTDFSSNCHQITSKTFSLSDSSGFSDLSPPNSLIAAGSGDSCDKKVPETTAQQKFKVGDSSGDDLSQMTTKQMFEAGDSSGDSSDSSESTTAPTPDVLKPLSFVIKVGDRIKCYPSRTHAENRWLVTATVEKLDSDSGFFSGCTVKYRDKKKGFVTARIPGGSPEWLVGGR